MRPLLFIALAGIAAIGLGVWEYLDLAAMEAQGGTRKVHAAIKLIYENLGKTGVLGVFGAAGILCLGFAGVKLLRKPRAGQTA